MKRFVAVLVAVLGLLATLLPTPSYSAPKPTVKSLSPTAGPLTGGTTVTIVGTNLTKASRVTFGGVAGTSLKVISATRLTVRTPAVKAAAAAAVTVTSPGGSVTASNRFAYTAKPTVSSLSPVAGPLTGGTTVTIVGTNLSKASRVTFGGVAGTSLKVISANQLTVTTPPARTPAAAPVTVTTPGGSVLGSTPFLYAAKPTVTSVLPATGPRTGGTTVTIEGANLSGASQVTFGGIPGTSLKVISANQVTVTTPAVSTPQDAAIAVLAPGGHSTGAVVFRYEPATDEVQVHTGPMTSSETWTGRHQLGAGFTVPAGVVLTLKPGVVVTSNVTGILLKPGGALISEGTAGSPVTVPWISGGDAEATEVRVAHTRFNSSYSSSVTARTAVITFVDAPQGLNVHGQAIEVTDSRIAGYGLTIWTLNDSKARAPVVQRNVVTGVTALIGSQPRPPIYITSSLFAPSKVTGNRLSGNSDNTILVRGNTESFELTEDWTVDPAEVRFAIEGEFVVPAGRSLRIPAGAELNFGFYSSLAVRGALIVEGTAQEPGRLRGMPARCSGGRCWQGVYVDGSSPDSSAQMTLRHARIEETEYVGGQSRTAMVITDSTLVDTGLDLEPFADVTIVGNTFIDSAWSLANGRGGGARIKVNSRADVAIEVTDNRITEARGNDGARIRAGILIEGDHDAFWGRWDQPPTVERNVVNGVRGAAIVVAAKRLDPARLEGNQGAGNYLDTVALAGRLEGDLSHAPGTLAHGVVDWDIDHSYLEVPEDVTWTVPAGQEIAVVSTSWCTPCTDHVGPSIEVSGTFIARGTPEARIRVTTPDGPSHSARLAGIGGSGTIDIDYADLGPRFYYGFSAGNGAKITVAHSTMTTWRSAGSVDAKSSLTITDSDVEIHGPGFRSQGTLSLVGNFTVDQWLAQVPKGATRIRGSIDAGQEANAQLVQACKWESTDCSVDATHTDWGTEGPLPRGAEPRACGTVLVSPYTGGPTGPPTRQAVWSVPDCGGQTQDPYGQIITASSDFQRSLTPYEIVCASGEDDFQAACDMVKQRQQCVTGAVEIAKTMYGDFDYLSAGEVVAEGAAAHFYEATEGSRALASDVAAKGIQITQAVTTVYTVREAYAGCVAPPR